MGRRLRTTFLLGVLVGLALALIRAVREGRTASASLPTPAPALPVPAPRPEPVEVAPEPAPAVVRPPATSGATVWAAPVDGGCPEGYPVKAKESSKIFHVPGGLSYERTKPDRCYPDPATAEADGFRPAKR